MSRRLLIDVALGGDIWLPKLLIDLDIIEAQAVISPPRRGVLGRLPCGLAEANPSCEDARIPEAKLLTLGLPSLGVIPTPLLMHWREGYALH